MVINRIRSVVPEYPIMVSRAHACASKRHAIGPACSADQHTDRPGARFTKYLTTILRLSYDNVKVTVELWRTLIYKTPHTKGARLFVGTIYLQSCKIVWDSVRKFKVRKF